MVFFGAKVIIPLMVYHIAIPTFFSKSQGLHSLFLLFLFISIHTITVVVTSKPYLQLVKATGFLEQLLVIMSSLHTSK